MTLVLGLDTGGTFTDAALLDTRKGKVLATAKSLTTKEDLSLGVGKAIELVLAAWGGAVAKVERVSLSTTLATNAVVEGVGGRICLILIGFDADVMSRGGLHAALGSDPVLHIAGGHKTDGSEQARLDEAELKNRIAALKGQISSFAVAAHFATRNPGHEATVRDILHTQTGLPVTCSHELSDELGGPKRALTTLLNARLISLLEGLIKATEDQMTKLSLNCPLMVVKGDGSLLQSDYARSRPVETVLSGPAASLSGAAFLAKAQDALVADIGGTTTDIARLRSGTVQTSDNGAMIGNWRTCVQAAHIRTSGLGGDSEVRAKNRDLIPGINLGPRRAIPLSLLSQNHPQIKNVLQAQLSQAIPQVTDGRFVVPVINTSAGDASNRMKANRTKDSVPDWLSRSERELLHNLIKKEVCALAEAATTQVALGAIDRLVHKGLAIIACFTPTDAAHVLGRFDRFDIEAAQLGAALLARQKSAAGEPIADTDQAAAQMVIDALTDASTLALMDAALADDLNIKNSPSLKGDTNTIEHLVSSSAVLRTALLTGPSRNGSSRANSDSQNSTDSGANNSCIGQSSARISLALGVPLIALGASATTYYPAIAMRLGAQLEVPEHADVAGSVGAAIGAVRQRAMILVTQPSEGCFRVHLSVGPKDFKSLNEALALARTTATAVAKERTTTAGATGKVAVSLNEIKDEIPIGPNKTLFLQAVITAEAEAG